MLKSLIKRRMDNLENKSIRDKVRNKEWHR